MSSCIEHEDALDWEFVRRVPSTHTWRIVDSIRALNPSRRASLCREFAADAVYFFEPDRDPSLHPAKSGESNFKALHDGLYQTWSWDYANVRTLRAILGDQLGKRPSPEFANTPVEVLQRAQSIHPTNAREIRKEVKEVFGERYKSRPANDGGGDWRYAGCHRGRPFVVRIDYGGWDQLRYDVEYEDAATGLRPRRLSYERLVGAGLGHWDMLTADNLEESVRLLCELVERLVDLPDRLAALG